MCVTLCCYCNDDCTVGLLAIRTLLCTHISLLFATVAKHNCCTIAIFSFIIFFVLTATVFNVW